MRAASTVRRTWSVRRRALLADALASRIDAFVVESLDRLSRDQVELERIVRRLEHQQIRIVGVSDSYDSAGAGRKVLRAVRGIVAELYLDDLRAKVHRGLGGKVTSGSWPAAGRSATGWCATARPAAGWRSTIARRAGCARYSSATPAARAWRASPTN
ncbi:MAG: recombinase family protein [Burkholderiaceae bacterium]